MTVKVCPAAVIVPLRCGPLSAATEKLTDPLPLPLAPAVIVIQAALLAAVQAQPVVVETLVLPLPPAAAKFWLPGVMLNKQPEFCVTVKVCPAAVIVPLRCGPLLATTEKLTEPLPLPDEPPVIVIQAALLAAVQVQPVAVETLVPPPPPAAATFWLTGLIE